MSLQGSTVRDRHVSLGSAGLAALGFNLANDIQTFRDLAKDNVLSIQPGSISSADKELAAICVRTGVGHTKCACKQ
jgi:hypothetical protein